MKIFAAAALMLLAYGPSALAQISATTDPAKLALARQVVEASGGQKQVQAMLANAFATVDRAIPQAPEGDAASIRREVSAGVREEVIAVVPELLEISAHAYADQLTLDQLRDWLAWEESPSGRAIAAKRADIQNEALVAILPLMRERLGAALHASLQRVCAQRHCTEEQRKAMEAAMSRAFPTSPS
ncbi:MAG: DUF2059 domain-containing protein [Caulobacteraceae bacterium]|nr:DUF2059 domain-containing protein [Caulobacteraceae bacterium]